MNNIKIFSIITLMFLAGFTLVTAATTTYSSGWSCDGTTCECSAERCPYPGLEELAQQGEIIDLEVLNIDIAEIEALPPAKLQYWLVEFYVEPNYGTFATVIESAYDKTVAEEKFKEKNKDPDVVISHVAHVKVGELYNDFEGNFFVNTNGEKVYAPQESRGEQWYVSPESPEWAWNPDEEDWVPSTQVPLLVELEEGSAPPPQPAPTTKPAVPTSAPAKVPSAPVLVPLGASSSAVSTTTTSVPENCLDKNRCDEIDKVWLFIVQWINPGRKEQIFDTIKESFRLYRETKPSVVVTPGIRAPEIKPISGKGLCFQHAVSASSSEAESKLVSVNFKGKTVHNVHKVIAPLLQKVGQEITVAYDFKNIQTYNWRCINNPSIPISDPITCIGVDGNAKRSAHSYGVALDINPVENPFCQVDSCPTHPDGRNYDLPEQVIQAFKNNDFSWGGDWTGKNRDYMHFEWRGNIGDFDGDGKIESCPGLATSQLVPPTSANFCVATQGTDEQKALLDMIAWAEGTREKYNVMFSFEEFTTYSSHPIETGEMPSSGITKGGYTSTAAGRYQFKYETFKNLRDRGQFKTGFGFQEQDTAAVYLVDEVRKVSDQMLKQAASSEDFVAILDKLAPEWASLPYSPKGGQSYYGQPVHSSSELTSIYLTCLEHHSGKGAVSALPSSEGATLTVFKNSILEKACKPESLICVIPPENVGKEEAPGIGNCRPGMVQVGNICIDQYEAMLVDKNTDEAWSPYCNPGKEIGRLRAVSIAGAIPQSTVSQLEAKQACENAGKTLCTEQQWLLTCQGTEGRRYPYEGALQKGLCNDETKSFDKQTPERTVAEYCTPGHEPFYEKQPIVNGKKVTWNIAPWMLHPKNNQQENSLEPSGSNVACKTPEQVYDLVGNLDEWVDGTTSCKAGTCGIFLGGFYDRSERPSGTGGCTYRTDAHAPAYTDYSLGFRCCTNLAVS